MAASDTGIVRRAGLGLRQPWDQRLDESDSEYRAFVQWLAAVPRYLPAEPALAASREWSTRAQAWDALHDVPEHPVEALNEFMVRVLRGSVIQARKYELQAATSDEQVDPKNLAATMTALAKVLELWQAREAAKPVESIVRDDLPDEVLEVIDGLAEIMKGL